MKKNGVPELRAERLSRMVLLLQDLIRSGKDQVTSSELGRYLGTSPSSVRKDLGAFTEGRTGSAYHTSLLLDRLKLGLNLEKDTRVCLVGLDLMGMALLNLLGLKGLGWKIVAGFDSRLNRLEQLDLDFPLYPTTEIAVVVARMEIQTALITSDPHEVQKLADRLILGGIRGIINFSSAILRQNRGNVIIQDFSPASALTHMGHLLNLN